MSLMVSVSGVRGIVGPELNPEVIGRWVRGLSEILPAGPVVVGRDSRPSGEALAAVAAGCFGACGRDVYDVGLVPTPTVQLAVEVWGAAGGVILSASHNPAPWNALKFVDVGGSFLAPNRFEELRAAVGQLAEDHLPASAYGRLRDRRRESLDLHLERVLSIVDRDRIGAANLRAAIECGHGAGGVLLPELAKRLGVQVAVFHEDPSGQLLADPEPSVASLTRFAASCGQADLAIMVDPDADRCGLVLPATEIIGEEWTLPLVTAHRLAEKSGTVVTNLSTSTWLEAAAEPHGATVRRSPVGEAHVVAEMRRVDAVIGGEGNGGVIDPRVHLGRDSAVAFVLLCAAEATVPGGLRELAASFPSRAIVKEKINMSDNEFGHLAEKLSALLGPAEDTRDGLWWSRVSGFVHVRASNTEPIVRVVVESGSDSEARELMGRVRRATG